MSRHDGETSTSKDDASRAHPGRGRFLRGSTWAIGDYTPSKQVNKVKSRGGKVHLLSELTDGWLEKVLRSMSCCPEIACLKLEKVADLLKTMGQLRKKGHPTSSIDG
jgi:hypothetical protein